MSLRIVPAASHEGSFSHIAPKQKGAPSAPGVHDMLRTGVAPTVSTSTSTSTESPSLDSRHPLEARLKQWEATQTALRMETLRRAYGVAEPVRRQMELQITREGEWRPAELMAAAASTSGPLRSVHEEILTGRDTSIGWEDVFAGTETRTVPGMHDEMERKLKM